MTSRQRSIKLEVEVSGSPEEVWDAVATGPGISSWYVPHTIEERQGGAASASFGVGPEMQVPGRVVAWEPPHRFVLDGGTDGEGLVFEWLVERGEGGTCVVRLINSGYESAPEGDAQYDGMTEGWKIFLRHLQLHLAHFGGRYATASLPMATWPGPRARAWSELTSGLGIGAPPTIGDRLDIEDQDGLVFSGVVVEALSWRISMLVDSPCPGTAFLAAEGESEEISVSIWSYLYGPEGSTVAGSIEGRLQRWLTQRAGPSD